MSDFTVEPGHDAKATPRRLLLVQGEERPPVDVTDEPMVMTFPHLVVRELIAFLALSLGLIVLALTVDAPLDQIADPTRTPNPAKAPWYFLGLQELLHYYPPVVSGVLLPSLLVIALLVIPYFRINLERPPLAAGDHRRTLAWLWGGIAVAVTTFYFTASQPVWPLIGTLLLIGAVATLGVVAKLKWLSSRSLAFWIFAWFLLAAAALTIIGVFFRGPGWRFTLPWRDGIFS